MNRLALLSLVCLLVSGCAQPPDNPERRAQAVELADRFLQAVAGAEPDRGWSLLHPSKRDEWGSEDAYRDAVSEADWSRFEFTVLEATYCDDGIWCRVRLDVRNGPDSVPELLRSSGDGQTDGLTFEGGTGEAGNAAIRVVLDGITSYGTGVFPDPG